MCQEVYRVLQVELVHYLAPIVPTHLKISISSFFKIGSCSPPQPKSPTTPTKKVWEFQNFTMKFHQTVEICGCFFLGGCLILAQLKRSIFKQNDMYIYLNTKWPVIVINAVITPLTGILTPVTHV